MAAAPPERRRRRAGKVALAVLANSLGDGDVSAVVVQGRFRGEAAVAALVEGKVDGQRPAVEARPSSR